MKAIVVTKENKTPLLRWQEIPDIQAVIDTVFAVDEAQAAHAYVRENRNFGKVVLEVTPGG